MNLIEIQKRLDAIKDKGFIFSLRKGPTGIGYTLENELGLEESNIAIPDIGGRVELKASRKNSKSLITLFTFNRAVWKISQKEVIEKYGYGDKDGRQALYNTVWCGKDNSLGFYVTVEDNKVNLNNRGSDILVASWSIYTLVGKFISKFSKLIYVLADSLFDENGKEKFHFNKAYLLEDPTPESFIEAFQKSIIGIDIRMHLKPNSIVRNHGTGIRIFEKDIHLLFGKKRQLI